MLSDNYILDSYAQIAQTMLPDNIATVLVEGNNKLFYQNLIEFEDSFVTSGGSCYSIKEKVDAKLKEGVQNYIGIIDNDFFEHTPMLNIFIIDYYCIENISLEFFKQFSELKKILEKFFCSYELEYIQTYKLVGKYASYNKKMDNPPSFNISFESKYDISYKTYIEKNIVSIESFFKYINLKQIIESYANYYKITYGKKNQIRYIHDLATVLPTNSTIHIFDKNTDSLLKETLYRIENS